MNKYTTKFPIVQIKKMWYNMLNKAIRRFIMIKKPDIKVRKRLRLTMCFLYLLQILVCTFPFFHNVHLEADGSWAMVSPFYMVILMFQYMSGFSGPAITASIFCMLLILIPTVGFFASALDKERNIKNIISILCCFGAVFLIATMLGGSNVDYLSIGAVIAILLYIIIMFITSIAMVMRLSKDEDVDPNKPVKKRKGFKFQEFDDDIDAE